MIINNFTFFILIAGGFAILTLVMLFGFISLKKAVDRQAMFDRRRQKILIAREKAVLAASLIGEITENKNKCNAFVTIYSEVLRSLREDKDNEKRSADDFIHKSPSLSRSVYDGNLSNLSMLEPKLVTRLAEVYAMIETEPEYINLEANMSEDVAIRTVEMVVKNAESLSNTLDDLIPSLEVVVRNVSKISI